MKFKKILFSILTLLTFMFSSISVHAAYTFTVSSSKTKVNPGDSFTVTVRVPGSGMFYASANNGSVSPSSQYCDTSCTFNATAGKSGTTTVTITAGEAGTSNEVTAFEDDSAITGSKSVPVSIKSSTNSSGNSGSTGNTGSSGNSGSSNTTTTPSVTYSKDNNLKSLTLSEGTLSPEFKASTTDYTVELGATVTTLTVNAQANDSKAKVKGTGEIELNPGENTIKITVTAENGNPKVYTIKAIVDDSPLVFLPYGESELGVVRNYASAPKLDGFEETTVKVNEADTKAWHSATRNVTLLYLQNGEEKNFYIYDEVSGVTSIYKPLGLLGNNLGIVDVPKDLQERSGMKFGDVSIDGMTLKGWTYENKQFANYSLIYAMDEFGEYNFYQYESTQKTLQLHSGVAPILQEDYDAAISKSEEMTMYFYIACGVSVISIIFGIVGFVNANRYKKRLLSRSGRVNEK